MKGREGEKKEARKKGQGICLTDWYPILDLLDNPLQNRSYIYSSAFGRKTFLVLILLF